MPENNRKVFSLKNDLMFKELFSRKGNDIFLKDFLTQLLKLNITKIKIQKDSALNKDSLTEKLGILDIKATINDEKIVNIEMQMQPYSYITNRATFYSSRMISSQLRAGDPYFNLKPVIVILILNYNMFEFEDYITETVTVAKKHMDVEINQNQKYYYIELPKFRKRRKDEINKLTDWLTFIDGEDKEGVLEVTKRNEILKKAKEELEYLNGDEEVRRLAELREKALRDEVSFHADWMEQGMKQGIRQGLKEGIQQGIKEGEKLGIQKGEKRASLNIAKTMLNENMDIDFISKVTNLSKEEIENIIKKE